MCGLCGIYSFAGQTVDPVLIERMNSTLAHRGPDGQGILLSGKMGMAHRRLSIIDLSTGRQPMCNEDGSLAVVFNGEIYNFADLRHELERKGHSFRSRTDTEVILHGYEQWGEDCLLRFRGMFAFALWNEKTSTLFLARDRLGKKPLYYSIQPDRIIFASEIKAILQDESIGREVDLEALGDYLAFGYVPSPKSIFRRIRKLPAGTALIQQGHMTRRWQYWDLDFDPDPKPDEPALCESLLASLEEATRIRLVSDVPLGAFLSGGIDSSIVVALMAKLLPQPVITSSIGFSDHEYSELGYAGAMADYLKTQHHEYSVSPDALGIVRKLAWHFDEPFADSSALPTYYVCNLTRRNVTVALSGDGGDENFAGYRRYYYDALENRLRGLIPSFLRRNLMAPAGNWYPKGDWLPQSLRAKTLLSNLAADPVEAYFNTMSLAPRPIRNGILDQDVRRDLEDYDPSELFRRHYGNCESPNAFDRTLYLDFKTYLPEDILTKVDRASMANSLEVRVPLLDHRFVEMTARIPWTLKLKGTTAKYILKRAASRLLPPTVLERRKMGFSIPLRKWMRVEMSPLIHQYLVEPERPSGFFDSGFIRELWRRHRGGYSDFSKPLWSLLCFELWAEHYLYATPSIAPPSAGPLLHGSPDP